MNASVPHQPAGWWHRNWKWFVPMLAAVALTLFVAAILAFMSALFGMIKSSDAYRQGLQRAQRSPAVVAALGEPVKEGWLVMGNISVNGPSGEANLQIPLSGPRGEGDLYLEATKAAGQWNYRILRVRVEGTRDAIDLLEDEAR